MRIEEVINEKIMQQPKKACSRPADICDPSAAGRYTSDRLASRDGGVC